MVDAVSWRILLDDIKGLYEGRDLGPKTSSYRQWVGAVQKYAQEHSEETSYWQAQCEGSADYRQHPSVTHKKHEGHFTLDKKTTQQLIGKASEAYHTEINDLLLTALAYVLEECFGNTTTVITLEGHGREPFCDSLDVSQTVGWFTTMFPVKSVVKSSLSESIKVNKETLRHIPNKGIGYGALKYANNNKESLIISALPRISFNYLGQFDDHEGSGWDFVNEFSGISVDSDNTDDHLININGQVFNGELTIDIQTQLDGPMSQQIINGYETKLQQIIAHCLEKINHHQLTYTPSDFKGVEISQALLDRLQQQYEIEALYPANSLQQGFIFHALSHPDDEAYRVQLLWDYHNMLKVDCYKKAWALAIETYPILRTCFNWEEEMIQLTVKTGKLYFTEHDISNAKDKDNAIKRIQEKDGRKI